MRSFWQPMSAILLDEPRTFAPPILLRMHVEQSRDTKVLYSGDRMTPAIQHGETIHLQPCDPHTLHAGRLVVATHDGIPDLYRVLNVHDDTVILGADSVPGERTTVQRDQVMAIAASPVVLPALATKCLRRIMIDLREAMVRHAITEDEKASSVRKKYESQAPHYARSVDRDLDPSLMVLFRAHVSPGGRVLVLGSGNGYDCFALARRGYRPVGVDFSPAMIRLSRQEAERRHLNIAFQLADLRALEEAPASFDAVLFTHDVFSLCPGRGARVRLLERIRSWLTPDGVVFLSARLVRGVWGRIILTLQWLRYAGPAGARWGDSHTRYLLEDGSMQRSFVHLFTPRLLRRELTRAGYRQGDSIGGHTVLSSPPAVSPSS